MRPILLDSQGSGTLSLRSFLLLVALVKGDCVVVVAAQVVKVLDLVDSDDPVLAGEGFLDRGELRALGGETDTADTVLGLAGGEEGVEVVVRHLVPVFMGEYGARDN